MQEDAKGTRKKPSLWQKLRHPNQYRLSVNVVPTNEDAASAQAQSQQGVEKPAKVKRHKQKKPKPIKAKKTSTGDPGGSKKKIYALVGAAALAFGAAVAIGVNLFIGGNSVEARLVKAQKYTDQSKYDKALRVYDELIAEEAAVVESYLGAADTYLASQDVNGAITTLEVGYQDTGDGRISDKLEEILPDDVQVEDGILITPESPITFADPAFERMVRQALAVSADYPILQKDLDKVRTLKIFGDTHAVANNTLPVQNTLAGYTIDGVTYSERGGIISLEDVRHFRNLNNLTVAYNSVRNLEGISEAQNLEILGIYANNIEDLTPLQGLNRLQFLYAYENNIKDVSPLGSITSLKQLWLQHNQIEDISSLSSLTLLEELFVGDNNIQTIEPISGMPKLRFLYAKNNAISDISAVAVMPSLTDVAFDGNPVRDYSPASQMQNVNRNYGRTV